MSPSSQYISPWRAVLRALERSLAEHPELAPGRRVLAACSGGADSVVLVRGLLAVRGGEGLALAHVDHGLRPSSGRDREFTGELARELGLPLLTRRLELGAPAPDRTGETTAREGRYRALVELARQWEAAAVATGHHRSDQLETVLFRILRGTGIAGLEGMPARRTLHRPAGALLIRPLLEVPGSRLRDAAREEGFPFVEDPTNRSPRATRNRIRLDLLPRLERDFGGRVPAALRALIADAGRVREAIREGSRRVLAAAERKRLGSLVETWLPPAGDALDRELTLEAIRRVVQENDPERWVGAPPAFLLACRVLLERGAEGKRALAPGRAQAWFHEGRLVVLPDPLPPPPGAGELSLPGYREVLPGLAIRARRAPEAPPPAQLRRDAPNRVWLDARRAAPPLQVRPRCEGDRFQPLGTETPRALKDFLIGRKVPRWRRPLLPLVTDRGGRILWVAGIEIDHRARITDPGAPCLELSW